MLTQLITHLTKNHLLLATAESCTGGLIAATLTDIPGSSTWFERGLVTYSNQAKIDLLGVDPDTLVNHGAVSAAVAKQMAAGAVQHSQAQIGLATTGIAGPGGGSAEKPVGTVWFGWALADGQVLAEQQVFAGDRAAVREQAVNFSLQRLTELLT